MNLWALAHFQLCLTTIFNHHKVRNQYSVVNFSTTSLKYFESKTQYQQIRRRFIYFGNVFVFDKRWFYKKKCRLKMTIFQRGKTTNNSESQFKILSHMLFFNSSLLRIYHFPVLNTSFFSDTRCEKILQCLKYTSK